MRQLVFATAVPVLLAACAPPGASRDFPTVVGTGVVTIDGSPLGAGWITVLPIEGTVGEPVVARIDSEGRFRLPRVPIGAGQVRLDFRQATLERHPEVLPILPNLSGPGSRMRLRTENHAFRMEIELADLPFGRSEYWLETKRPAPESKQDGPD